MLLRVLQNVALSTDIIAGAGAEQVEWRCNGVGLLYLEWGCAVHVEAR